MGKRTERPCGLPGPCRRARAAGLLGSTDNCVLSVAEVDAARLKTSFKPTKDFKPLYTGGPITGIDSPAAGAFLVAGACGESVNLVDWARSVAMKPEG